MCKSLHAVLLTSTELNIVVIIFGTLPASTFEECVIETSYVLELPSLSCYLGLNVNTSEKYDGSPNNLAFIRVMCSVNLSCNGIVVCKFGLGYSRKHCQCYTNCLRLSYIFIKYVPELSHVFRILHLT